MKSMGYALLAPLINEVVKKEKSHDHCQAAITHLTTVGRTTHLYNKTCLNVRTLAEIPDMMFRLAAHINSWAASLK